MQLILFPSTSEQIVTLQMVFIFDSTGDQSPEWINVCAAIYLFFVIILTILV